MFNRAANEIVCRVAPWDGVRVYICSLIQGSMALTCFSKLANRYLQGGIWEVVSAAGGWEVVSAAGGWEVVSASIVGVWL